jgi:7-cyano-7-deazaguanine synthase in queuosine biosynthesis
LGGGLDSSYLAVNIAKSNTKEQIIGIHFDYGQPASDLEREAVTRIGSVARTSESEERLVFRHNYPAKAINCL